MKRRDIFHYVLKAMFPCAAVMYAATGMAAGMQSTMADTIAPSAIQDSVATTTPITPQRTVTPIQNTDNLTARPTLHYYDQHGKPLDEPVAIWLEEDTVKVERGPKYPLYNGITVGINFFDGILQLAGQSYGSYNVSATVNLHNWFFPTIDVGIGSADSHPKGKNYHYKSLAAPFARIGIDYNFLYNSNPDYKALFGLRMGYSSFRYDITDINITGNYWDRSPSSPTLPRQKSSAFWGEVNAGIRVKIWERISMGWCIRYLFPIHITDGSHSSPWFIPGYGARNAHISASLSVLYTFGPQAKQIVKTTAK